MGVTAPETGEPRRAHYLLVGVFPKSAFVGGPLIQFTSQVESTVMNTSASFDAHAW